MLCLANRNPCIDLRDGATTRRAKRQKPCLLPDLCALCDLCIKPSFGATGTSPSHRSHTLCLRTNAACGWLCRINTEIAEDAEIGEKATHLALCAKRTPSGLHLPQVMSPDIANRLVCATSRTIPTAVTPTPAT